MKNINRKIAVIGSALLGFLASASPALAQTSSWSGVCVSENDSSVATIQGFQCLLAPFTPNSTAILSFGILA